MQSFKRLFLFRRVLRSDQKRKEIERTMRDAVIVDAIRTPTGRRNGGWADVHPVDLSAHALTSLIERNGVDPALVDDVIWGCVIQTGEQALDIGRAAVLAAGWPDTVPATTVDRQCGSSQQAVHFAAATVVSGQQDIVIAGGVESMTRVPMGTTENDGPGLPWGPRVVERYGQQGFNQGLAAELVAEKWGLTRTQVDEFSLRSHALAGMATDEGRFEAELSPREIVLSDGTSRSLEHDEGIRRNSSLESLSGLRPAFTPDGLVTAGNSSQISDGSSAILIMTSEKALELGLSPLARLHSFSVTGVNPIEMLTGPISATAKVIERSGLALVDIGAFEINEAFAPVVLAWLAETGVPLERVNPNGGAIALGHPLGASGTRLMTTLVHHMVATGIRYGLQTMCEGGGMANATILELLR
jgi:acetyl-CoA acyltransferase